MMKKKESPGFPHLGDHGPRRSLERPRDGRDPGHLLSVHSANNGTRRRYSTLASTDVRQGRLGPVFLGTAYGQDIWAIQREDIVGLRRRTVIAAMLAKVSTVDVPRAYSIT